MGLAGLYGSTAAGAARGLALRMDHGSQYLSDHFTNQIKFWGNSQFDAVVISGRHMG